MKCCRIAIGLTVFSLTAATIPLRAADYIVAPNGDDANPGSEEKPFRTIQKAADVMRAGDACTIQPGVYRETVTVRNSGTAEQPLRFRGADIKGVIVSGADPIKAEWSVQRGKIFKAKVAQEISQLFVDGEMMVEARWPNQPFDKRWDKTTWRANAAGSAYGKMADPALAETGIDWTGGLAALNIGAWQTFLRPVLNHGAGKDSFEYAKDLGKRHDSVQIQKQRAKPGMDYYFLFGKLEALDAPGEWFLDREAKTLYLWPPDGKHPGERGIEGKVREYGFIVQNKSHVQVTSCTFFATTLLFDNADDCRIENCELNYPTYAGPVVKLDGAQPFIPQAVRRDNQYFLAERRTLAPTSIDGERNVIRNCVIRFSEAPGIIASGERNTIENCLIHDIDWRGLGNGVAINCAGAIMSSSARSIFRRNTVHHIGSSEGVVLPGVGPSICEYNYVHHGGLVQSDGGLIQCHGTKLAGTVIRYNWVHDHQAFYWGGIGIRGDDLTRNLIVHHNVAWNCNEKGIMVKGDNNQVYHNTCVNNPMLDLVLWAAEEPHKEWADKQWEHLLKKQNEHSKAYNNYAPILTGQMPHELRRDKKVVAPACDLSHNITADASALIDPKKLIFRKQPPPLVNPAALDFRPAANSPLIDAGLRISGITQRVYGEAPDIGAYERGDRRYWIPGRWEAQPKRPIPADGATDVPTDTALIWLSRAAGADIYLGRDEKSVANADIDSPLYQGGKLGSIHHPPALKAGATYYWRLDVGPCGPGQVTKGDVWRFTCAKEKTEK